MRFSDAPEPDVDAPAADDFAAPSPLHSWAFWVSVVLHPLLMPTLLFATLLFFAPEVAAPLPPEAHNSMLLLVFLGTTLLPLLCLLSSMLLAGRTATLQPNDAGGWTFSRSERLFSIMITALVYTGVTYVFYRLVKLNDVLVLAAASGAVATTLAGLLTYLRSVSLHMVGVGGALGFVAGVTARLPQAELLWPLAGLVLLSGLLGTARLARNAHSPAGVFLGWLLGLAVGGGVAVFAFT